MTSQELKNCVREVAEKLADFLGDNGNQQNIAGGLETILNELTDSVEEIAQQDFIYIEVASMDSQEGFTAEEKALIRKNISNWPDIILFDKEDPSIQSRIIAVNDTAVAWYDPVNQTIASSSIEAE